MRNRIVIFCATFFLFVWWVVYPIATYNQGTSDNISVEVLLEPFVDGPYLVYVWRGNIHSSCPVDLRRTIVDSANVVTQLTPRSLGRLDKEKLGYFEQEIEVLVPRSLTEGPSRYSVVEYPKCTWLQRLFPIGIAYPDVEFTVSR